MLLKHNIKELSLIILLFCVTTSCERIQEKLVRDHVLVVPTNRQVEWAESEVGVLIHFDINVYEPDYNWRGEWDYNPDPKIFNPKDLDTDQWIQAAKAGGAKYAVLVAKHCTGFSLWPTEAHNYSVKSSPWRNGTGDIVADFIASCEKFGVKPGIYASATANGFFKVDNPGLVITGDSLAQLEYNKVVEKQMTELWSNYGNLFEIWFDGGVLPVAKGGPDLIPILQKFQPNSVIFQGPYGTPNLVRWVGNEEGLAAYPSWATADSTTKSDGTVIVEGLHGNPDAPIWCPGEADAPLRKNDSWQGGWFWKEGQDDMLNSLDEMMHKYYHSVGRNTNFLIGLAVDDRGLVPDVDVERMKEFGNEIDRRFGKPIAQVAGKGMEISMSFQSYQEINHVIIQEDITQGERIRKYELQGKVNGNWVKLAEGESVGNKRIQKFETVEVAECRLVVLEAVGEPQVKNLSVFEI